MHHNELLKLGLLGVACLLVVFGVVAVNPGEMTPESGTDGLAALSCDKVFHIQSSADTIPNGTHSANLQYQLYLYNQDDLSDTVLGDLSYSLNVQNIDSVFWSHYAVWNLSSAVWAFPPEFSILEGQGFGPGIQTTHSEAKTANIDLSRTCNQTNFTATGYQQCTVTVEFKDKDFLFVWAHFNADKRPDIDASFIPGSLSTNAPYTWIDEQDTYLHVELNTTALQTNVEYQFSFVQRVVPQLYPIYYKPWASIGEGLYHNETAGGTGYQGVVPAYLLPDGASYASATTNTSNTWVFHRNDYLWITLLNIVQPSSVDQRAIFTINKDFNIITQGDSLASGTHTAHTMFYPYIDNSDDSSDTVLGDLRYSIEAQNITTVDWPEFAVWNGNSVTWHFPPDFVIPEGSGFGPMALTSLSESKYLNLDLSRTCNKTSFTTSGYQQCTVTVVFKDKTFLWSWAHFAARPTNEVNASYVLGSISTTAPYTLITERQDWVNIDLNTTALQTNVPYTFTFIQRVEPRLYPIFYKPRTMVHQGIYHDETMDGTGYQTVMPGSLLPEGVFYASASTNVSNSWGQHENHHLSAHLTEVIQPATSLARFQISKDYRVFTKGDSFMSGTYDTSIGNGLFVYNNDDINDATLQNLSYTIDADSITEVALEQFTQWNATRATWNLPPEFQIGENSGTGVAISTPDTESKYINVNVNRWCNQTIFSTPGIQQCTITLEFEDTNFIDTFVDLDNSNLPEVNISLVPDSVLINAPYTRVSYFGNSLHIDLNTPLLEPHVPYTITYQLYIEPTFIPVLFKPRLTTGLNIEWEEVLGGIGYQATMPDTLLPVNVNHAAFSSNTMNSWIYSRNDALMLHMGEVLEAAAPVAQFNVYNAYYISTSNDTLLQGTYLYPLTHELQIVNYDDLSNTTLGGLTYEARADSIESVGWIQYAVWNATSAIWTFPPDFALPEGAREEPHITTPYMQEKTLNVDLTRWCNQTEFETSGYQQCTITMVFHDTNAVGWYANLITSLQQDERTRVSIVPETFMTDLPYRSLYLDENVVHIDLKTPLINLHVPYHLNVTLRVEPTSSPVIFKPFFGLSQVLNIVRVPGTTGIQGVFPSDILPDDMSYAAVSTNISNTWVYERADQVWGIFEGGIESTGGTTISVDSRAVSPGSTTTTSIWIHNVTNVGVAHLTLTYNPSVVNVDSIVKGQFDSVDANINNVSGITTIGALQTQNPGLTGDVKLCDVVLRATGNLGSMSPLDLTILELKEANANNIPINAIAVNGTFTVVLDSISPLVTNPSASRPAIPDDTDGEVRWGENTTLSVTVTDNFGVASVTINLSAIGRSSIEPMANMGGDIWAINTSALVNKTSPYASRYQPFQLRVNATDINGNSNTSVTIPLTVIRNGDVSEDNATTLFDCMYIAKHVLNQPDFETMKDEIGEVGGDHTKLPAPSLFDAMYCAKHVLHQPGFEVLH